MDKFHEESRFSYKKASEESFPLVYRRETDSFNTTEWKKFLNNKRLREAWAAPAGSPYARFEKTQAIDTVDRFAANLKPRYSEGELMSEGGVGELIRTGVAGEDTAIVLDSGGAHSVAMAVRLARELGYQPIVMFDIGPNPEESSSFHESLATLLYFSAEVHKLKAEGKIRAGAPPVFILDAHRESKDYLGGKIVDKSYKYTVEDFPDASTLKLHGISHIVYLNEANMNGQILPSFQSINRVKPDLKPMVKSWEKGRIHVLYTGVDPWPDTHTHKGRLNDLTSHHRSFPDIKYEDFKDP